MPDPQTMTMAEAMGKTGPALSATSDMPVSTPAEETPAAPPEAEAAEAAPEQTEGKTTEAPATSEEAEPAAEPPKVAKGVQKRLDELTAQREDQRRRADGLQDQLKTALESIQRLTGKDAAAAAAKAEQDDPRPKREAFDNPDAYDTALEEWAVRKATQVAKAEMQKEQIEATQRQAKESVQREWGAKVEKAKETHPDFETVALSDSLPVTNAMAIAIQVSENGTDVLYHLGQHPEEATRIAQLPEGRQILEIGRLSASLVRKPEISKTPPPINPLGSRARATAKTPDEESMEEYAARRNGELRGRRTGTGAGAAH